MGKAEIENALLSISSCIGFSSRDWSLDKRDAWLYGIVQGWGDKALRELAARFEWSDEECDRLERLNKDYRRRVQV